MSKVLDPSVIDIQPILDRLQVPKEAKAAAWDAFHSVSSQEDFQKAFDLINIPKEAKAALWDAKFADTSVKLDYGNGPDNTDTGIGAGVHRGIGALVNAPVSLATAAGQPPQGDFEQSIAAGGGVGPPGTAGGSGLGLAAKRLVIDPYFAPNGPWETAMEHASKGEPLAGAIHAVLGGLPILGPMAEDLSQRYTGTGKYAGKQDKSGAVAEALTLGAVPKIAEESGKITGSTIPKLIGMDAESASKLKLPKPTKSAQYFSDALGGKRAVQFESDLQNNWENAAPDMKQSEKDYLKGEVKNKKEAIVVGEHAMNRVYTSEILPNIQRLVEVDLPSIASRLKAQIPEWFTEAEKATAEKSIDSTFSRKLSGPDAEGLRQKLRADARANLAKNSYDKAAVEKTSKGWMLDRKYDALRDQMIQDVKAKTGQDIGNALGRYGSITDVTQEMKSGPVSPTLMDRITGKYITGTGPNIRGTIAKTAGGILTSDDYLIKKAFEHHSGAKPVAETAVYSDKTNRDPITGEILMPHTGIKEAGPGLLEYNGKLYGERPLLADSTERDIKGHVLMSRQDIKPVNAPENSESIQYNGKTYHDMGLTPQQLARAKALWQSGEAPEPKGQTSMLQRPLIGLGATAPTEPVISYPEGAKNIVTGNVSGPISDEGTATGHRSLEPPQRMLFGIDQTPYNWNPANRLTYTMQDLQQLVREIDHHLNTSNPSFDARHRLIKDVAAIQSEINRRKAAQQTKGEGK